MRYIIPYWSTPAKLVHPHFDVVGEPLYSIEIGPILVKTGL